jgi:6-phosphofructo-2-kinase
MRLKLSGPDYKDQDPIVALDDFRKRVALYKKKYVPLGDYEERNNMPYVQVENLIAGDHGGKRADE